MATETIAMFDRLLGFYSNFSQDPDFNPRNSSYIDQVFAKNTRPKTAGAQTVVLGKNSLDRQNQASSSPNKDVQSQLEAAFTLSKVSEPDLKTRNELMNRLTSAFSGGKDKLSLLKSPDLRIKVSQCI